MEDKVIITHPGPAHQDEFIACALIMACIPGSWTIHRREPTPEELADPNIYVVDVGMDYKPDLNNYDHHQDKTLPASFVLVAMNLYSTESKQGESIASKMRMVYPWWDYASRIDTDLFGAYKSVGLTPQNGIKTYSPITEFMLKYLFQNQITLDDEAVGIIRAFGWDLVRSVDGIYERLIQLSTYGDTIKIKDVPVLVHTVRRNPFVAVDIWRRRSCPDAAMLISLDERGDGWSLYRFEDDPRVDFSVLTDNPRIVFAHPGGFIAKTKAMSLDEAVILAGMAIK